MAGMMAAALQALADALAPDALGRALSLPAVWLALALQAADIATTIHGLRQPGVRERNPVLAGIMAPLGRAWPVAKLALLPLVAVLAAGPVGALWWVNAAMCGVVANNLAVIRRARP